MVEIINGYTYPFRGIFYLLRKKQLRKNSILPILLSLFIDVVVLVLMFKFAYTPQFELIEFHILKFFWTWLNKVITFIIVILEVYIVAMIVINIFLGYFFEKTFDQVLALKGCQHLLDQEDSSCIRSLRRSFRLFQIIKIVVSIVTLPLNFVPTLGSIAYYSCNGIMQGWDQQDRYFDLKRIDSTREQWQWIKNHFKNMLTYGIVSFFLECIPILGVVFNITNAVGIALYDCHLEKKSGNMNIDDKNSDVSIPDSEGGEGSVVIDQPKPTEVIDTKKGKTYGTNYFD